MKNGRPLSGYAMLLAAAEWPTQSSVTLRTISERDLLLHIQRRLLRGLTIVETDAGLYRLRASLAAESNDVLLAGASGLPRQWSSLDSLAKQIRHKYGSPARLTLSLTNPSPQSAERSRVGSGPLPEDTKAEVAPRSRLGTGRQELTQ